MNHDIILSTEFKISIEHSKNIIALIDEGNTIPFIARYRKEMTGECDDQALREFADRLAYLRKLDERKEVVTNSITEQGAMTNEIAAALAAATTLTEVEDIYRPYKPKRKTRATIAIAKGLSPLAQIILAQSPDTTDINSVAAQYIDQEKGVLSAQEAVDGALDIIAEQISDNAFLRKILREQLFNNGVFTTNLIREKQTKAEKEQSKKAKQDEEKYADIVDEKVAFVEGGKKDKKDKLATYQMYDNYTEPANKIVAHRILAINRGEKEDCIKCDIVIDEALPTNSIFAQFLVSPTAPTTHLVEKAALDAYKRLIKPSVENEVRAELFEKASEQAI
ncbi:MAG: hypothetical protein FWD86_03920, partial [Firmicutes bacterium]|nr:hypothetical protein [Bacillota bacterium]